MELERLGMNYSEEGRSLFEENKKRWKMEEIIKTLRLFRSSIGGVEGDLAAKRAPVLSKIILIILSS